MDIVLTGINPSISRLRSLFDPLTTRFGGETSHSGGETKDNDDYYASAINFEDLDYLHDFEAFSEERGGSVSFGFAGCDYQVEFYCPASDDPDEEACMTPSEAEIFVLDLFAG